MKEEDTKWKRQMSYIGERSQLEEEDARRMPSEGGICQVEEEDPR